MKVNIVTVVGANGTMGANVSAIFAAFGNAKVYMVSRTEEKARLAITKAIKSVRAEAIRDKLIPVDYSKMDECISKSDVVFESVAENLEIKVEITKRIGENLRKDAIACSGTSGLSATKLAECFPEELRVNYFGVHMFNPPYNMSLCELIPTEYSDRALASELKEYLQTKLHRTVVVLKDSPAFLANRIGFYFINRAFQYAEKYKKNGGIDYIDAILGSFTGRVMSPLVTADFVGLDVHKAIVDNIYENTKDYENETFILPEYVKDLIDKNMLGRKTNVGIYKIDRNSDGTKTSMVYDIEKREFRERRKYVFVFADEMKTYLKNGEYENAINVLIKDDSLEAEICLDFLLNYIIYSLYAANEVGEVVNSADDVMATGFNWCPPIAMVGLFNKVCDFRHLVFEKVDKSILKEVDVDMLLSKAKGSNYDYRPFFKAK